MAPARSLPSKLLAQGVVLAVSSDDEHLRRLRSLFNRSSWMLYSAGTVAEAREWISRNQVPVVLCESALPDGNWKDILELTSGMKPSPSIVVASRIADERLWAEVLNLGGYDVLALPADRTEVFRAISSAWRNWKSRSEENATGAPESTYTR